MYRYLTPGPTQLYPSIPGWVKEAVENDIPSISHRSSQFREIYRNTADSIRKVLGVPESFHIFFLGSATEAMERIVEGCVEKKSFHFVNGVFSRRFFEIAMELRRAPEKAEVSLGEGFGEIDCTIPKDTELICFTYNETSSGVSVSNKFIADIRKSAPNSLVAVDVVSAAPYCLLDYTHVDAAFFSVQKGFGLPAGLGCMIVGPRCIGKSEALRAKGSSIGSYHSLLTLLTHANNFETPETPNVLGIYLLGKVAAEIKQKITQIRSDTEKKAKLLYTHFEKHPVLRPFVANPTNRSQTVIVINTPLGSEVIINQLMGSGIIVGAGHGSNKEKQIRIANFPMHSLEDMQKIVEETKHL